MSTKSEIKALKNEIKELKLDMEITQSKYRVALRKLNQLVLEEQLNLQKSCKCESTQIIQERRFTGESFEDVEYTFCNKCKKTSIAKINSVIVER